MELVRYVRVLRRWLWMIVALPIIAAAAAGIVSFLLPPVYEAQIYVVVRPAQLLPTTDATTAALTSDQILHSYALLMTQQPVLESVVTDLGLRITPDDLQKKISVTVEPTTDVLNVKVQDTSPALARNIADKLVDDFIFQATTALKPKAGADANLVKFWPAVVADKPVFPHIPTNIVIGFGAGLLVALGMAFLLDYLDQSIKSDAELTERLGLLPLAHIAFVAAGKGGRAELVALDGQSPASEAYKALRTSLMFSTIDRELKTVVVTSSGPGEGKSRTAANLAVVLAGAGHKTLLIDADFRRPSMRRIFGRLRDVGFANLILEDAGENEAITPVENVPNLWMITAGPIPPNPSELLGSGRVRELMARLRGAFAYVILDTPPVNAVTDAAILAAAADATILVVEQGRTTFPALEHAKQLMDRVGARTVGVVMNKVRSSGRAYRYDYGSYAVAATGNEQSGWQPELEPRASAVRHHSFLDRLRRLSAFK